MGKKIPRKQKNTATRGERERGREGEMERWNDQGRPKIKDGRTRFNSKQGRAVESACVNKIDPLYQEEGMVDNKKYGSSIYDDVLLLLLLLSRWKDKGSSGRV